jgi:predicted alpha/beta hydrolase family esterase
MRNESIRYLIVPGWQGSPEDHWQSHWQNSLPNSARVEQDDWLTPRREDWVAALAEAIAADSTPVILIAHSLGCVTVAHWAATAPVQYSAAGTRRVAGCACRRRASGLRPGAAQLRADPQRPLLPFPSQVVSSDNDAAVSAPRALELARNWGAEAGILAGAGHINVKSGHQRWEQGFAYLYRLQNRMEQHARRRA